MTHLSHAELNNLTAISREIFENNKAVGWWTDEEVAASMIRNGEKLNKHTSTLVASKIALCHSELSEALEGMRKGLMDDHLPHRSMVEVELADTVIRICDLAGFLGLDLGGAIAEKLAYNAQRADHKLAHREGAGGKTI